LSIVPWQTVADLTGAVLLYVPAASLVGPAGGGLDIAALAGLVTPNTKFVSLQHVSNVLGMINPIKSIIQYIRANAAPNV
jgi:cysteine desulfurase/selenocysteine lyase